MTNRAQTGFTLIEMSIVLVIIGLIIGGVLVGRDLIDAAAIRAQISQIEKYNAAVNTFRGKYGYLPGDIPEPYATQNGLVPRGLEPGMGDGNGIIQGQASCAAGNDLEGAATSSGEPVVFWNDLSYANGMNINLIEGSYNAIQGNCNTGTGAFGSPNSLLTAPSSIVTFFPLAKIGQGNYVYVYSIGGTNYFGISVVSSIIYFLAASSPGLSVSQAYQIDRKVDDGLPQSGRITAQYVNSGAVSLAGASPGTPATASSATCYDNGGNASNPMQYSMGQNNGAGINCALSFQFQ